MSTGRCLRAEQETERTDQSMQIITGELAGYTDEYPLSRFGGRENILAVDIETTGITAEKNRIYLIGCGYWEDDCWKLIQWFDDTGEGEADILTSFLLFTKKFTTLLHYNGRQFDLPFLARRIVWNGLQGTPGAEDFPSAMKSLDLYRYVKPFQKLFSLPDCRQQTVEAFLETGRRENRSGKELISVYLDYIQKKQEKAREAKERDFTTATTKRIDAAMINQLLKEQELLNQKKAAEEARRQAEQEAGAAPCAGGADPGNAPAPGEDDREEDSEPMDRSEMRLMLLSHNAADVSGLIAMTQVLSWKDLLSGSLTVYQAQANTFRGVDGIPQQELVLHARIEGMAENAFRDHPVTTSKDGCYCTISGGKATLKIPIYNGKLRYFYPNYKDYYYLPELDQAIHKSIAAYVDPQHRQQATAETCYTGKVGTFLPEWSGKYTPLFRQQRKDATVWFEFKPEMKKDKAFFAEYATYVFWHVTAVQ